MSYFSYFEIAFVLYTLNKYLNVYFFPMAKKKKKVNDNSNTNQVRLRVTVT